MIISQAPAAKPPQGIQHVGKNQIGLVSIMVTFVLMIVISLIVLGFAQLTRRNQQETLDRQLSTQAFYAAEAGVNDAQKLINDRITNGLAVPNKTDCQDNASGVYSSINPGSASATLNVTNKVAYTCVMINANPTSISIDDVSTQASHIVPISSANGSPFDTIEFTWKAHPLPSPLPANLFNDCPSLPTRPTNQFKPFAEWTCSFGVLRFDLVPTNVAGGLTRPGLQAATMTSFVIPLNAAPSAGGNQVNYAGGTSNSNNLIGVRCVGTSCGLKIKLPADASNQYYVRLSAVYQDMSVVLQALDGTGAPMKITGAQAIIDVTGKAQDVLRRIQVNVPLNSSGATNLPDYAIETSDPICKRFTVLQGYFSSDANLSPANTNKLCL
jgi:Tfp pilus assembly protein PilX